MFCYFLCFLINYIYVQTSLFWNKLQSMFEYLWLWFTISLCSWLNYMFNWKFRTLAACVFSYHLLALSTDASFCSMLMETETIDCNHWLSYFSFYSLTKKGPFLLDVCLMCPCITIYQSVMRCLKQCTNSYNNYCNALFDWGYTCEIVLFCWNSNKLNNWTKNMSSTAWLLGKKTDKNRKSRKVTISHAGRAFFNHIEVVQAQKSRLVTICHASVFIIQLQTNHIHNMWLNMFNAKRNYLFMWQGKHL